MKSLGILKTERIFLWFTSVTHFVQKPVPQTARIAHNTFCWTWPYARKTPWTNPHYLLAVSRHVTQLCNVPVTKTHGLWMMWWQQPNICHLSVEMLALKFDVRSWKNGTKYWRKSIAVRSEGRNCFTRALLLVVVSLECKGIPQVLTVVSGCIYYTLQYHCRTPVCRQTVFTFRLVFIPVQLCLPCSVVRYSRR